MHWTQEAKEVWKPIKGYEGLYEISSLGRIWSLRRNINMKPTYRKGYRFVSLSGNYMPGWPKVGEYKHFKIGRLVLLNFIGTHPDKSKNQCNHKDGVKDNDRLENLEWLTPKENTHHAWRIGLCKYEKTPEHIQSLKNRWLRDRRLPIEIVKQIKEMRIKTGLGKRRLSRIFRVSENIVGHILRGLTYREVIIALD